MKTLALAAAAAAGLLALATSAAAQAAQVVHGLAHQVQQRAHTGHVDIAAADIAPTAVPTMAGSEIGVSRRRSGPRSSMRS